MTMFGVSWYVIKSFVELDVDKYVSTYTSSFFLPPLQAEYMPVSEQNRNQSTSLAIPSDNDHEFLDAPDGPDDTDAKDFTIS